MKKLFLLSLLFSGFTSIAQTTFTTSNGLLTSVSNGADPCVMDMNADNLDDIVRLQGTVLKIDYQQPNGTFVHQTHLSTGSQGLWSICGGDLDNNGYNDLLLADGSHVEFVYANSNGTAYTSILNNEQPIFCQRSTLADIDVDGHLDAFVCDDVDQSHPYRNNGSGVLNLDFSLALTLDNPGNYAAIWTDYDNDRDIDLYITKCGSYTINQLYRNNGDGSFTEVGAAAGVNDGVNSWSTVFEDFDNDGDMDAFVVNHQGANRLYDNNGDGTFSDIIAGSGINANDLGAWESMAGDFNNDGWMDIFSQVGSGLYINNGDGTFTDVNTPISKAGVGDLNNDGFLDLYGGGTSIYFNNGNNNKWLKLNTIGTTSNRSGIGTWIELYSNDMRQVREVRSGESFSPMNSLITHFGVGNATTIDALILRWPSGTVDLIADIASEQMLNVTEGDNPLQLADMNSFNVNNCGINTVLSWNPVPGAIQYEFFGQTANPGGPSLSKTTSTPGFSTPVRAPNNLNVLVQVRVQYIDDSWSEWAPLTPYTISCGAAKPVSQELIDKLEVRDISHLFGEAHQLYPNPASDYLMLQTKWTKSYGVEMINAGGQVVRSFEDITSPNLKIDVKTLEKGLYLIRIFNDVGEDIVKISVQ